MTRLVSTKVWFENTTNCAENHENLVKRFERKLSTQESIVHDDEDEKKSQVQDEKPINLLLIDGGGMLGYAFFPIILAIQEMYFKDQEEDFFSYFDLLGGTSVGGIINLFFSHNKGMGKTIEETLSDGRDLIDDIREKVFGNMSWFNLLLCQHELVTKNNQIINLLRNDFDVPLKSNSIPTMTLLSTIKGNGKSEVDDIKDITNREFEPFVARTYEHPKDEENHNGKIPLAKGSSDMMLYEACAATSAVPLLLDRVRVTVDGEPRTFADGMMFENCPMAICLDEASCLYPNRPIGVVLSIGFSDFEDPVLDRTIECAKNLHPNMHYQRIMPQQILQDFFPAETDLKKIAKMEAELSDWIRTDHEVLSALSVTMQKLLSSKPRVFGKSNIPQRNPLGESLRLSLANLSIPLNIPGLNAPDMRRSRVRNSVRNRASVAFMNEKLRLSKILIEEDSDYDD